jgi:hypothetical protein
MHVLLSPTQPPIIGERFTELLCAALHICLMLLTLPYAAAWTPNKPIILASAIQPTVTLPFSASSTLRQQHVAHSHSRCVPAAMSATIDQTASSLPNDTKPTLCRRTNNLLV